jgi:hypothetical protein
VRPELSVVVTTDNFETIRPVVECLQRQTIKHRIELVIVAPRDEPLAITEADTEGLLGVRVVTVADVRTFGGGRAAGVLAASAPVVVIGETHTYAHPGWAEALVAAHTKPWPIVVPGVGNANPASALSWGVFLMDYGRWFAGLPAGETALAPTHNSSYKREMLLGLGPRLDTALAHGDELALYCQDQGHRAWFEPAARIDHLNIARPRAWLEERFLGGLLIGGRRAVRWPWWRRLVYFAASPLVPAVLLYSLRQAVGAARRQSRLPAGSLPAVVLGAVVWGIGEAMGYLRGARQAESVQMTEYELHKARYAA